MTSADFQALCEEAPLQGPTARVSPRIRPLTATEAPAAGTLLGLDAEFVALSQPDQRLVGCAPAKPRCRKRLPGAQPPGAPCALGITRKCCGCASGEYVEVRPARLGLARISGVRGEGPEAGTACIDDYVRTLEPVTDYLTKWSGLVRSSAPPCALTCLRRRCTQDPAPSGG